MTFNASHQRQGPFFMDLKNLSKTFCICDKIVGMANPITDLEFTKEYMKNNKWNKYSKKKPHLIPNVEHKIQLCGLNSLNLGLVCQKNKNRIFMVFHIFFCKLKVCDGMFCAHKFYYILNKCRRFCIIHIKVYLLLMSGGISATLHK